MISIYVRVVNGLCLFASVVPWNFMAQHAISIGLGKHEAAILLTIMNGANLVGKLTSGIIIDLLGISIFIILVSRKINWNGKDLEHLSFIGAKTL